ncbi:MAG TPA: DUF3501 family protein [Myxococcota bacterium]
MKPLGIDEIVPLDRYGPLRDAYRERVIAYKRMRRVALGEQATLLFEDRETLRFQVQEMLWVERIGEPAGIQAELDVYNELMPGEDELSATLFLEIAEASEIRPTLERLVGLDRHIQLVLGEGVDETSFHAHFDRRQFEEERISAVQYLRFPLGSEGRRRLASSSLRARLRASHLHYRREEELPPAVRESLVASLARDPAPLLALPKRA